MFFTLKYLKNNGYFLHYMDGSFSIWYACVGTEYLEIIKLILSYGFDV